MHRTSTPATFPNSFGSIMEGRSYEGDTNLRYRFGFNGHEMDDEVYGEGNVTTAEYWEYDTRLGRRWNGDPVVKSYLSIYSTFRNNPIIFTDPDGRDDVYFKKDGSVDNVKKRSWLFELFKGNRGFILGADNNITTKFIFNDYRSDKKMFLDDKGEISGNKMNFDISFNDEKTLETVGKGVSDRDKKRDDIEKNGTPAKAALSGIIATVTSSTTGGMDYLKVLYKENTLYIKNGVAFNDKDFGNFLWGLTMNELGFSLIIAKAGAHYNNMKNINTQNNDVLEKGFVKASWKRPWKYFDSPTDQRAIRMGWKTGSRAPDLNSTIKASLLNYEKVLYFNK